MRDFDGSGVLAAIRDINTAGTPHAVLNRLSAFVEGYGFERIFLGQLVNPANVPLKDILFLSDWPEELKAQRRSQLAILHDPIALSALRSKHPFTWAEAREHASLMGRKVMDLVHDYGISHGMMFPMHALHSVSGGVSLGAAHRLELCQLKVKELEIVCSAAYYHLESMLGPFPYQKLAQLTPRETECVQFAAAGKSNLQRLSRNRINRSIHQCPQATPASGGPGVAFA